MTTAPTLEIYLARNNQQAGPYSLEQLNLMLANGQVQLTDLAWHVGMTAWQALGELTGGQRFYQPTSAQLSSATSQPNSATANPASNNSSQNAGVSLQKQPAAALPTPSSAATVATLDHSQAPIASLAKRLTAAALDTVMTFVALIPMLQQINMGVLDPNDLAAIQTAIEKIPTDVLMTSLVMVLMLTLVQAVMIIRRGQSLGKLIMGIYIVDRQTRQKPSTMNVFVLRSVLMSFLYNLPVVGTFVFLADLAMLIFSPERISLHDRLAKTIVVDSKSGTN